MNVKPTISAGIVLLRRKQDQWRYLLLRVYNFWDFPKGIVEPGEAPLMAAIREVQEETTLIDPQFHWGHEFIETEPYGKNKIARYYIAESAQGEVRLPVSPELGHPEHDEFRWLTYDSAQSLLVPRVQNVLAWAKTIAEKS